MSYFDVAIYASCCENVVAECLPAGEPAETEHGSVGMGCG